MTMHWIADFCTDTRTPSERLRDNLLAGLWMGVIACVFLTIVGYGIYGIAHAVSGAIS